MGKTKKILPLMESFINIKKFEKLKLNDEVMDELNQLDNSVQRITVGNGHIITQAMSADEAEGVFGLKDFGTSSYVYLKYTVKDKKGKSHRYSNRFICICYNESFPVWAVDLKDSDVKPKCISTKEDFHEFLKKVVNKDSFLRSLKRAKEGKLNVEDDSELKRKRRGSQTREIKNES
ncbi:hypothetical protein IKQ19_11080 [Candidatus Saccharibacteria bacterium]|nr:hypothetical protein [Candidatus Saccharibacteria bacterium]